MMPDLLSHFMTGWCWKANNRKRKAARLLLWLVLALRGAPDRLYGQFTDAHSYDNTPVGLNELELVYAYVHSDASIDPSIIIAGARLDLNQGSTSYTRYFGLVQRMAWVKAGVTVAGLNGLVSGTGVKGSVTGMGDSAYEVGMLLRGGPALNLKQFEQYRPTTTAGASLVVTAPTGQYESGRILNLGSSRWSFRPEIAVSYPFGPEQKWQLDAYANAYFFTANTSYRGVEILRQEPLPGIEGHISYSLINSVWASLDTRYSFRGATSLDGTNQNNGQRNFSLGTEVSLSVSPRNSFIFEFATALVHKNGPALTGFAVKYNYTWGKGYP